MDDSPHSSLDKNFFSGHISTSGRLATSTGPDTAPSTELTAYNAAPTELTAYNAVDCDLNFACVNGVNLDHEHLGRGDLIVAVGGDGTVLIELRAWHDPLYGSTLHASTTALKFLLWLVRLLQGKLNPRIGE